MISDCERWGGGKRDQDGLTIRTKQGREKDIWQQQMRYFTG